MLALSAILVSSDAYARGAHNATSLVDKPDGSEEKDGVLYSNGKGHYCCDMGNARYCDDLMHEKCSL